MEIRDAIATDLPTIVEIYNASIPSRMATADTELISVESRLSWFREHSPTSRPLWVIENEQQIAGWLSFRSFYGRPAYQKTAELSLYISPHFHRQGMGKRLLERAIAKSPELGLHTLVGFIFAHNLPSLNLFSKYHFQPWGYLPRIAELDGIERDLVIVGCRCAEGKS
jgi:phosphinothricin acetyltransferase